MKASPADVTGCNCPDGHRGIQHAALVRRVDESYTRDPERARARQASTSSALRAGVLAASNGHTT